MTPEEIKAWREKRGNISRILFTVKLRAVERGVPFNLDHKYLVAIAPDLCPVFKIPLLWGYDQKLEKNGTSKPESPSLDRIVPELGYVKGNVAWISQYANRIKSNVTDKELYAVADWLQAKRKEVLNGGGARPPSMDDPSNTYLVLPAHTAITNDAATRERGGY